jgi:DNA-binding transcriptional ArsR family regulator
MFIDVADAPVVIGYPIERNRQELARRKPLADLLGRTRAAVLGAVNGGRSTTELARAVGTSIASASQHAAVLRSAGLISTHRTGPSVCHWLTPLGESLLQASSQDSTP